MKILNQFNPSTFLNDHWQKKPLIIRDALSPELFALTPEELAGLACEEAIESRLITGNNKQGYQLKHGPFVDTDFTSLPDKDWTVLVQAVDHWLPEVAELLDYFRFIPNWRIDDVMVSYATPGGSAGPHYDNYDVFLIQGAGTRLWQVGEPVGDNSALLPHADLRLLRDFQATQEWELQAGDILYLPPRYAHWGIAKDKQCMTYSVGFRSPSIAQLLSDFCDDAIIKLDPERHYEDPDLRVQNNPGEITAAVIDRVQQHILEQLSDQQALRIWLGNYLTLPKYADSESIDDELTLPALQEALQHQALVIRNPACRFAYITNDNSIELFVDGKHYALRDNHRAFAELLCGQVTLSSHDLQPYLRDDQLATVLLALFARDSLYFADDLQD